MYNHNNAINNNTTNNNTEENNNCNYTDEKVSNKIPEFVKDFVFSQDVLNNMKQFLTTKISSNEMNKANTFLFVQNKDQLNENNTRIDLVNRLFAKDVENNTSKYIDGQFRIKPFMYGKWQEVNTKQKLHNSCFDAIKKLIIHSDLEKAKLGVKQNIMEDILFGSNQENEIESIISNLENKITSKSENEQNNIENIVNNTLNVNNIKNINDYLLSNISKERINLYLSILKNILVQYGNHYIYLLENNDINCIVLVNEHFNPFGEEDTPKWLGKAYNILYTSGNKQINNNIDKVKAEGIEQDLTKYVSLFAEDDTEQYYISGKDHEVRFILPTLFNDLIKQNNNEITNTRLNKLINIKSLLYANYLLRYFNLKCADYNYEFTCKENSWFSYIVKGNNSINTYLEKDLNNTFNETEKSLIRNIINEINRIYNSNNESKNKMESIVRAIRHIRSNLILTSNGKIKRITKKDLSYYAKIANKTEASLLTRKRKRSSNNNIGINNNNSQTEKRKNTKIKENKLIMPIFVKDNITQINNIENNTPSTDNVNFSNVRFNNTSILPYPFNQFRPQFTQFQLQFNIPLFPNNMIQITNPYLHIYNSINNRK